MLALLIAAAALAAEASPAARPSAALTADLDGTGRALTAKVSARGKTARLEIADAKGKLLSAVDAPAPGGASAVRVAGGSLGSPGTLIEVIAAGPGAVCRTFWRFREGRLARLPARRSNQELPDCARADGWSAHWEKKAADAPAVWVRERTRQTPRGTSREREVYAFSGFALDFDSARSSGDIGGVAIPSWRPVLLYTPSAIDDLAHRFELTRFRAAPRLVIRADRAQGLFALEFKDRAGRLEVPITATAPGAQSNDIDLTLKTEAGQASARVTIRGTVVTEAIVAGLPPQWNGRYQPASRLTDRGVEIYDRAEDELASNDLVGLWSSDRGEQLAMNLVPGTFGVMDVRSSQFNVSLDPVPAGTDVLLLPRDGTAPTWALVLKGANGISRVPLRCGGRAGGSWNCETAGPAEAFHRVGGRMNAR